MPAILTHDFFGRDIYHELHQTIGGSKDEFDSFLLGCQGPDILFFSHLNPAQASARKVGTQMHRADPVELFTAFLNAIDKLPAASFDVGRSYFLGLVCHYILDSALHPFIYAQQYAICDADIDGLDRSHGHEVHAEIESELDVLTLSTKREITIKDYDPEKQTLRISKPAARLISFIYKNAAAQKPICCTINEDAYLSGLSAYRLALGVLYSPTGIKRSILGAMERLFRDHSFTQAMSHRNMLLFESDFDNRAHAAWMNPWTKRIATDSFWDIYNASVAKAQTFIQTMDFNDTQSRRALLEEVSTGLDFNGCPTRAMLLEVEDL